MTVILAILLALGVPFASLHTTPDLATCCCPSPEVCACDDHDAPGQSTMKSCRSDGPDAVQPALAAFVAPRTITLVPPARMLVSVEHPLSSPHAPPAPRRPDAPF